MSGPIEKNLVNQHRTQPALHHAHMALHPSRTWPGWYFAARRVLAVSFEAQAASAVPIRRNPDQATNSGVYRDFK